MPIFEYQCFNCDKEFEKLVMGTNSNISCPDCGTIEVEKKFSIFGIMSGAPLPSPTASSGCSGGCSSCSGASCTSCH